MIHLLSLSLLIFWSLVSCVETKRLHGAQVVGDTTQDEALNVE